MSFPFIGLPGERKYDFSKKEKSYIEDCHCTSPAKVKESKCCVARQLTANVKDRSLASWRENFVLNAIRVR